MVLLCLGVKLTAGNKLWRPRLLVPTTKLGQITTRDLGHTIDKVIAGYRLSVKSLKVQTSPCNKLLVPQQGMQHAHHFRTLFIHRQRVKVGDVDKRIGAYRVSHGPGILGKLVRAEKYDILNPLHAARIQIRGKLGVAKNGKALFEG